MEERIKLILVTFITSKIALITCFTGFSVKHLFSHIRIYHECDGRIELEDLEVLKHSPDLLNNVKIGQGQLRLIIQTYFVLPYMGSGHFDQVT